MRRVAPPVGSSLERGLRMPSPARFTHFWRFETSNREVGTADAISNWRGQDSATRPRLPDKYDILFANSYKTKNFTRPDREQPGNTKTAPPTGGCEEVRARRATSRCVCRSTYVEATAPCQRCHHRGEERVTQRDGAWLAGQARPTLRSRRDPRHQPVRSTSYRASQAVCAGVRPSTRDTSSGLGEGDAEG